jgi:hypothetical protein
MDDAHLRDFFLQPPGVRQREYEALRAVFVGGLSQKEAAGRFDLSSEAFRQLVHSFRQSFTDGAAPPFSSGLAVADPAGNRPAVPRRPTRARSANQPKPPTYAR